MATSSGSNSVEPTKPDTPKRITHLPNPAGTGQLILMNKTACPACTLDDILSHPGHWECATCGHEWPKVEAPQTARIVKDANGTPLTEGDTVALIKDLKLGSGSQVLKAGSKAKNIRLQDGDHEIACKIDGSALALKACFVKKV